MSPRPTRSLVVAAGAALTLLSLAVATPLAAARSGHSANVKHRYLHHHRVKHRGPTLALRLSGSPGTVNTGQQVTYTATVVNTGRRGDSNAGFEDLISRKASLVSTTPSQGSCNGNPTIVCNLGALSRGASATVTIVVTANEPGWMGNVGWVSTRPPGHWEHRHFVATRVQGTISNVDLRLSGSPATVDRGQQVTYTATVTNSGSGVAGSVAFQDLLPGKASLVSTTPSQGSCNGNPTVVCSLGALNAGASATVTIVVTANQSGLMTDHGWVSSNPPGNWQHHRTVNTDVRDVSPELAFRLSGSPGSVNTGQQVTYTATVTNSGSGVAGSVAFQDLLPGKASLVSTTPSQGSCNGNPTVVCSLGALNAGASATVTIVVTANQSGLMTDHGWVSSNPPGNWQHHRTVNTDVRDVSPELAFRLSGSPGSVNTGQQVTYTATVINTGKGLVGNAGFEDLLPNNTALVSVAASQGSCAGSPTIVCSLGALNPGDSATVTIVVTPNQAGAITDRAWVSTNPPGHWEHERSVVTSVHQAPAPATTTTGTTTTSHP